MEHLNENVLRSNSELTSTPLRKRKKNIFCVVAMVGTVFAYTGYREKKKIHIRIDPKC